MCLRVPGSPYLHLSLGLAVPLFSIACGDNGGSAPPEPPLVTDAGANPPKAPDGGPRTSIPDDWDRELDCRAAKVSVGAVHACAITRGGHLFCWGMNYYGQLGARGGDVCDDLPCARSPVPVTALDDVVGVSVGTAHTCALLGDGAVYCFGSDQGGTLGTRVGGRCNNPWAQNPEQSVIPCTQNPTRVEGVADATDVDGWGRTCVAERGGKAKCWGWEGRNLPAEVQRLANVVEVEDGCAMDMHGSAWCWGQELSASRVDWDGRARGITKGYNQVCLVDREGALHCWGLDIPWADGVATCVECAPVRIDTAGAVAQASGGLEITWIRMLDGRVQALTEASLGAALELPGAVVDVSAGYFSACAVLEDGTIHCWANPGREGTPYLMDLSSEPSEVRLCDEVR